MGTVEMQICLDCSFVQVKHAFSDEALRHHYADYRSPAYNEERTRYEPTYAALSKQVGIGQKEIEARFADLTAWLEGKIERDGDFSMLDYGGSDGRFLPQLDCRKYVFEISSVPPLPGVVRIDNEANLGTYSYVQISHVLEHVSEPLALVKHISNYVKPSGYLYIEVPQDRPDDEIAELKKGRSRLGLFIHEHINLFCPSSVTALVHAAGLDPVRVETTPIDWGWATGTVVRALCRKRS